MNKKCYDIIVIGAGSVGVPTTLFLSQKKLKVLCIDKNSSPGQGQNKAAIGGVRATHSDPAKIKICQTSIDIFSRWEETYGKSIGWKKGGYSFPVFSSKEEKTLKELLPIQKNFNLNIDWIDAKKIRELIPGINENELIGGTYSPDDGQVCSLKTAMAMEQVARTNGAEFRYRTKVVDFVINKSSIISVRTEKELFHCGIIVNTAGAEAGEIAKKLNINIPIIPDSHEAGVSAPIKEFLNPLVVDIRASDDGKSSSFYFGQNHENAIIFCYTPNPLKYGTNKHSTSEFLPVAVKRLVSIMPKFKNLNIRRIWRGLYPMTPDAVAIVGKSAIFTNLYLGTGMCGQGLMMGPGIGKNLASLIYSGKPEIPEEIFASFSPDRDFKLSKQESLK